MQEAEVELLRTWQEIAVKASKETDPKKLTQIIEELRRALKLFEEGDQAPEKKSISRP